MATVFSAPEIDSAESVGVKSGGIKAFDTDVIRPVSNLIRDEFSGSKQLEFRWRSDSSRFFSPKDTKLMQHATFSPVLGPVRVNSPL
jgi:hypothetical protein